MGLRPAETALDRAPGYAILYHSGTVNHCPGCAGTQWLVGRASAQCAHCGTALPLARQGEWVYRPMFVSRFSSTASPV